MAGLLLTLFAAWGATCDLATDLDAAERSLFALEYAEAGTYLALVEEGFACGPASTAEVARFWLLTAGLASFTEDDVNVDVAFTAARAADSGFWVEALGVDLKARWEAVPPVDEVAVVTLDPPPWGYEVRVDGNVHEGPLELPAGLHVIQVHDGPARFGRVLRVVPGQPALLPTGLEAREEPVAVAPAAPVTPTAPEPPSSRAVHGYVALGVDGSFGQRWTLGDQQEPGVRGAGQLEAGISVVAGPLWIRGALGGQLLLSGHLYVKPDGEVGKLPVSPMLHATVGTALGDRVRLGVLAGAQLPSRIPLRAVGAFQLAKRLQLEARLGVNLVGEASIEDEVTERSLQVHPAATVLFALEL